MSLHLIYCDEWFWLKLKNMFQTDFKINLKLVLNKKRDLSYTASIPRTQSNSIKKHQVSSNLGENAYQRYTVSKGGVTISGTFSH